MTLVRVPRRFYEDHAERDLPTPAPVRITKAHVFVAADDPRVGELYADAEFYSDPGSGFDRELLGMCRSARATVRAIEAVLGRDGAQAAKAAWYASDRAKNT